jgi:hypothetical protein
LFYKVRQSAKWFSKDKKYSDINWADFSQVVSQFRGRIEKWYIEPGELLKGRSGHYGFPVLALSCMLIDTLSQYEAGVVESSRSVFQDYVDAELPGFNGPLPSPIDLPVAGKQVTTYAELLYKVRCGVLHEAGLPLYSGIRAGQKVIEFVAGGKVEYSSGSQCPSVDIDPFKLFDDVKQLFLDYVVNLLDSDTKHDARRLAFAAKFSSSFGVDLRLALSYFPSAAAPHVQAPPSGGTTPTTSG